MPSYKVPQLKRFLIDHHVPKYLYTAKNDGYIEGRFLSLTLRFLQKRITNSEKYNIDVVLCRNSIDEIKNTIIKNNIYKKGYSFLFF